MQKISPCLWFDGKAEEAAKFYVSVFKGKLGKSSRYDAESAKVSGQPAGSVLTIEFKIRDMEFTALNGGPLFKFTEAISFVINCKTQKEIDHLWGKLSAVKASEQCGWLKDKFGVSWQIVPEVLGKMLSSKDKKKAQRTMHAMLQMKKLDIAALKRAYDGK